MRTAGCLSALLILVLGIAFSWPPTDVGAARDNSDLEGAATTALAADDRPLTESRIRQLRTRLSEDLARMRDERKAMRAHLKALGYQPPAAFGTLIRERRDRLRRLLQHTEIESSVEEQLGEARLQAVRLEERLRLEMAPRSGNENAALVQNLQTALDAQTLHIARLTELAALADRLREEAAAYLTLLDERLFWIPSAEPFGPDSLAQLSRGWSWLMLDAHWRALLTGVADHLITVEWLAWSLLLIAAVVFRVYGRPKDRLRAIAADVGNVGRDGISLTLRALGWTLALALPAPLALAVLAAPLPPRPEFAAALDTGLRQAAQLLFLLLFFYHACRRDGVAHRHFRWRATTLNAVRRHIPWFASVLLPVTVLTSLSTNASAQNYEGSLGRIAFIAASIATALFAHTILRGLTRGWRGGLYQSWGFVIHALMVGLPLALMGLSILGYQYTAVMLEGTLFVSAFWALGVALVYFLVLRAYAITERRMKLARLRAQRARESGRGDGGSIDDALQETLYDATMDVAAISAQTRALLRMAAAVALGVGLWMLWADVFPAFAVLDETTVWNVTSLEGDEQIATVTMRGIIAAFAVAFGTLYAARNVPGLMEVAFLQRLSLGPGISYAVTTLTRYTIAVVGAVTALSMLGARWSELQWLMAALGVGLGFGLQDIVANFISGLVLLFERPFRVGDTITVGGHTGTVSRIRFRATTLTDWDLKEQFIPNKTCVTEELTNWTLDDSTTRVTVRIGVALGADVDVVKRILEGVAAENARVLEAPPALIFCTAFAESRTDFELRVYVAKLDDILPVIHELHAGAAQALQAASIEIPRPQHDVHLRAGASAPRMEPPEGANNAGRIPP